uniref:Large ribosomal subunit protein uL10m n=1 Tax=Nothobranchius korthausae TaxID=1143690 RepID=A0A1A8G0L0_9TELE
MAATLFAKFVPKHGNGHHIYGWLPLTQTVRHGSKAVTRHRKPLHFLKQKLLAVTKYIPPAKSFPPGAYPSESDHNQEDNGLTLLRKKDLKKIFEDYKMIAVVQNNCGNAEEMVILKHGLHKHGISVKFFPNKVTRSFLINSVYCNMAPLFIGPTVLFVSKEPKVKEMLTSLRASPHMTLLGACIDDTLLSVQGIVSYSKLPAMTVVQGELVSGLTMLTSHTASLLQRHPAHLSALLQQYIKQQNPNNGTEATPTAEQTT